MCSSCVAAKWMQTICLADVLIFHRLVTDTSVCATNFVIFTFKMMANLRVLVSDDPPVLGSVQCTYVTSALNKLSA